MTLPREQRDAFIHAKRFLCEMLDPKATPGVPKAIRGRAYMVLRHYAPEYIIEEFYPEVRAPLPVDPARPETI